MPRERPHQRIADDLRRAISSAELAPGDKLPTIATLRARYGVAAQTVTNALDVLKAEGLVEGRAGSGVYVRARPTVIRMARNRLSRSERAAGRGFFLTDAQAGGWRPQSDVTVSTSVAADDVAAELHVEPGAPVLVRDRVMSADGVPVQLATSYLPRDLTVGTAIEKENSGPGGIIARLEEQGHQIVLYREQVTQGPATAQEARRLRIAPGTPLWRIVRTAYSRARPVEVNRITIIADRVELIYELPAE